MASLREDAQKDAQALRVERTALQQAQKDGGQAVAGKLAKLRARNSEAQQTQVRAPLCTLHQALSLPQLLLVRCLCYVHQLKQSLMSRTTLQPAMESSQFTRALPTLPGIVMPAPCFSSGALICSSGWSCNT